MSIDPERSSQAVHRSHLTWEFSSGPIDDARKDWLEDPIGGTEVHTYPRMLSGPSTG